MLPTISIQCQFFSPRRRKEALMAPGDKPDKAGSADSPTESELELRRQRLESALAGKDAEGRQERDAAGRRRESSNGMAYAVKISSEFIAGVVVGAALGWLIDKLFDTGPWGLIIFLLLGFCAGVLNVLRSAGLIAVSKSERGFDLKPSDNVATPKGNAWADEEED
jgi:ATP synthase protein I